MCNHNNPLSKAKRLTPKDLKDSEFITVDPTYKVYDAFISICKKKNPYDENYLIDTLPITDLNWSLDVYLAYRKDAPLTYTEKKLNFKDELVAILN